MAEWANKTINKVASKLGERLLSLDISIPGGRVLYSGSGTSNGVADIDMYKEEISVIDLEYMSFQKDYDENEECKPSFEQLSRDKILEEVNLNIQMLKSFEVFLQERTYAFNSFLNSLSKARSAFLSFQSCDGTIRQSLDNLLVFHEQELQQSKLQLAFNEQKREICDFRTDAQRRVIEYQRELDKADKEIIAAEKRLSKSKEQYEKSHTHRIQLELIENDIVNNVRRTTLSKENRADRILGADESIIKYEKEVVDDISHLLKVISLKDSTESACRRAFQNIYCESRKVITKTLKILTQRERESADAKEASLSKLEAAVQTIDVEADMIDFINTYKTDNDSLVLSSHALHTLIDIFPPSGLTAAVSPTENSDSIYHHVNAQPKSTSAITTGAVGSPTNNHGSNYASPLYGNASDCSSPPSSSSIATQSRSATPNRSMLEHLPTLSSEINENLNIIFYGSRVHRDAVDFSDGLLDSMVKKASAEKSNEMCDATAWLSNVVTTNAGRNCFISVLNQFRSKKVDVGEGFSCLGSILLATLNCCVEHNDVHTAKVIMMLSQTFYRARNASVDDNDNGIQDRAINREYLKDTLMQSSIWHDKNFWEQVLWQLITEQLQTIPYDTPWYDMTRSARSEIVSRVHNVIFSQLVAITHSMTEFGCIKRNIREFLYRMCVIHQLGEIRRQQLLTFLHTDDDL